MLNLNLEGQISKRTAAGIIVAQAVLNTAIYLSSVRKIAKKANELLADRDQRIHIFKEGVDFLVERADPDTIAELNQNLEYWRVIRGINPPGNDEEDAS
jgi:hypothetical protein